MRAVSEARYFANKPQRLWKPCIEGTTNPCRNLRNRKRGRSRARGFGRRGLEWIKG